MGGTPRIVLLAFDGFPLHAIRRTITPNLWRLCQAGDFLPDRGRCDVPSTTYPGFTSLLTGAGQWKTGVRTTAQRSGAVPGWAGTDRTALPTIVHAAREAGLTTAVVMGDQKLEKVLCLDDLDRVWPSGAVVPAGTEIDRHGYPTNAAVRPHLLEAAGDPEVDLLFAHLNETDTLGHDLGPSSPETFECAHAADAIVGELLQRVAPEWGRTIIVAVSDHDMTRRIPFPPIDPTASPECAGLVDDWIADGCAAWLRLAPGADPHTAIGRFAALDGVESWRWRDPDILLLLAAPGRVFAAPWVPANGIHGSVATARTMAIVGGGHPAVPEIAASIRERSPRLRDWAPTLACLMNVALPDAEGLDIIEASRLEPAG